jgi:hypothetical protein
VHLAVTAERLKNQQIEPPGRLLPPAIVERFGAIQAQEFAPATWALALRTTRPVSEADIVAAFDAGDILRTHVMRPTWHFVSPADIAWLLELTAPHVHRRMATYNRQLGLEAALLNRAAALIERALRDGVSLTRAEIGPRLADGGIRASGSSLAHIMMHAELERVVCSGPRRGRQSTYALLAERAPEPRRLSGDEAVAELARRFLVSHGPATVRDFVWWSGLPTETARRGLDMTRAASRTIDGRVYWSLGRGRAAHNPPGGVHLLPIYDEYTVAYRDREAVPYAAMAEWRGVWGNATFQHAVLVDGRIVGTWKVSRAASGAAITVLPLGRLGRTAHAGVADAAARYGRFLQTAVTVSIAASVAPGRGGRV